MKYEVPPLAEELLTIDSCWEKKHQLSLKAWLLVGQPYFSRLTHIQELYEQHKLDLMN